MGLLNGEKKIVILKKVYILSYIFFVFWMGNINK